MFGNKPFRLGELSSLGRKKEPIFLGLIVLALLISVALTWVILKLIEAIKQRKRKKYLLSLYWKRKRIKKKEQNSQMKPPTKFTINYIRQSWLDIWQQKGYYLLEPVSLIPQNDPSLLWVNSGVATLKKYFNNPSLAPARNLVNCQPVIRTDDLANINPQSYHQTLFEMLGVFSIGSNFKKETIPVIWEWLTSPQWLNLNSQQLFVTVLPEDKITHHLWKEQKNFVPNHVILGSKKTNFWDMGDGPCGPCTEIFYDTEFIKTSQDPLIKVLFQTDKTLPTKISDLENKRFLEIGNIVFSEYYHQGQKYLPLEQKCVDFGGGLERIALVLQDKKNTFEIDLWEPVIKLIGENCKNS